MMEIEQYDIRIPDFAVVVLIGVSGSGKSTFARKHFLPTEILSSDEFRGRVSDDENSQAATQDAFDVLHYLMGVRLKRRKTVVIDATNVQSDARKPLLQLAQEHDCLAIALVLDVPERVCFERNQTRPDRNFGMRVVANQSRQLRQSVRNLKREGFRYIFHLSPPQIETVQLVREPLWTDRRSERGPFDIIGDIHGCQEELLELLARLGYARSESGWQGPDGRRLIFLGDLVDRGPKVVETVQTVWELMDAGLALCVPGNHDNKLLRALKGNPVSTSHGLATSLHQIEQLPEEAREAFKTRYLAFAEGLVSHLWLEDGKLCVAHAGMKEAYIGRASSRVREFALYGEATGETDEFGLPVRYPWAMDYRGSTVIAYGHTPVPHPEWLNNTINLDTGCVFGGALTALRWPEREMVAVPAKQVYTEPARPLAPPTEGDRPSTPDLSAQWDHDALLRVEDVIGKRVIESRLLTQILIPAENAAAALEVMSRFAVEPRWLLYLPPTMSPCETAPEGELLERPEEAFAYYRDQGVAQVVCQRKHMGSRAVVVVCRNENAARQRFGTETLGQCYTRTGRQFFDDATFHEGILQAIRDALTQAGFWEEFSSDWFALDCELMPWSAKAQGLLREQYAPVGAAAQATLTQMEQVLQAGLARGLTSLTDLAESVQQRRAMASQYTEAYSRYCWQVQGVENLQLAPFQLLASEGQTYLERDHLWQMRTLARLAEGSPLLMATDYRLVDLADADSQAAGTAWWREMTEAGGEGMVVKPFESIVRGPRGLVQPAVKVRGQEYLRIIYGPEYTEPSQLNRLRARGLGAKRSLALREFALGVEALERFVRREPLRRVHECVFGVLALESEPVDPRL